MKQDINTVNAMRNLLAALCTAGLFFLPGLTEAFSAVKRTICAVWVSPQADQTTTLHYAAKSGTTWEAPVQLTINKGYHFTPVIAADSKGTLWLVWVEQTEAENVLRYATIRQGKTETGRINPAGKEQSYAPAMLIDQHDLPLVAWSGVTEGQLADIYTSRWNGAVWEKPVRAHTQNQTPDILPFLGLREKSKLWLSWLGISKAEDIYVRYQAELHNDKWQIDSKTGSLDEISDFIAQRAKIEQFPEQAGQRLSGALFAGLDSEIQSVSEQFVSFHNAGEK